MSGSWDCIPAELRERAQWVAWRLENRDGKTTKVPYRADGNGRASTTDPATWSTFETAVRQSDEIAADGIGYVFAADDPYIGVDLDADLDKVDRADIVFVLDSYTEQSVSGTGLHVICKATLNGYPRHRRGGLEVYDAGRFFVVTGDHVLGTPTAIEERQAQLEAVLHQYLPAPETVHGGAQRAVKPVDLDDQELLEKAMTAKNSTIFAALWNGQWEGRYPSQSEADLALCDLLAFWTGRDPERIDQMFRASGLMRAKWERNDYRASTIDRATAGCTNVYEPSFGTAAETPPDRSRASDAADSASSVLGAAGSSGVAESALKDSATPDAAAPRGQEDAGAESDSDSDADPADSGPDSGPPFALPVREFITRPRTHREPLLAGADGRAAVGHRSLTLCGALGGHGKTTFFVDLALHLSAGVDYPPFTVPSPVSILMIENEGPEELFAEKLEARLATFEHELKGRLDVCVFDWGGFSVADPTHRERLRQEIVDKQYDLVFGDPLDSLGIEGVGSPEDTRKFLELMKATGLNKTVAWWLNTHPRKEETKEALNEIAGAWGGKPDTVFLLRMLADDRTQIRQPKLRWARRGKGPTLLFGFDPDTEAFSYIGEESDVERDYLAEVRDLLKDGQWRIVKQIASPKEPKDKNVEPGIGANDKAVTKVLEEHPDVFEMRTGDEAKALGRKTEAKLWRLRPDEEPAA